jgi:hypothetical protein
MSRVPATSPEQTGDNVLSDFPSDQSRPFRFAQDRLIIQPGNQKLTWERAVKQG